MRAKLWSSQDGKCRPLHELDLKHIRNIVKYLKRLNPWLEAKMKELGMEADDSSPQSACVMWVHIVLTEFDSADRKKHFELNGDMAQQFNELFGEDEDDAYDKMCDNDDHMCNYILF
jgi:hypothetical protein